MKRGGILIVLVLQIIYAKVPATGRIDSSVASTDSTISNTNLKDGVLYVSGDAYVYGLTKESNARVVYSYKEDKGKLKKISNKKLFLTSKKETKKIQEIQTKGDIKEIKISNVGGDAYFSKLQTGSSCSSLPTNLSKIAGLTITEEIQMLIFYDYTSKIVRPGSLFFQNLRLFRFCRPPPELL